MGSRVRRSEARSGSSPRAPRSRPVRPPWPRSEVFTKVHHHARAVHKMAAVPRHAACSPRGSRAGGSRRRGRELEHEPHPEQYGPRRGRPLLRVHLRGEPSPAAGPDRALQEQAAPRRPHADHPAGPVQPARVHRARDRADGQRVLPAHLPEREPDDQLQRLGAALLRDPRQGPVRERIRRHRVAPRGRVRPPRERPRQALGGRRHGPLPRERRAARHLPRLQAREPELRAGALSRRPDHVRAEEGLGGAGCPGEEPGRDHGPPSS
jgi:hypothetical protein